MTPFEYVEQYHKFNVNDSRLGLNVSASITGYNNKYSTDGNKEMIALMGVLAQKYFKSWSLPRVFSIPKEPRIDPAQHFSIGSLNRAFQSRGSPYEFRHALRLAFLAGRCTNATAANYCKKWFTNDCVAFAGNYTGVSPSTPIFAYAEGISAAFLKAKGVVPDIALSADIVHIPPRQRAEDITQGDLLLTFGKPDSRGINWRHIAVVQDYRVISKTVGELDIAEWGWNIAKDHTASGKRVTIHNGSGCADSSVYKLFQGVRKRLKGSHDVIAFNGTTPVDHLPALRIFFDASSLASLESRGWLIAGKPAPY